MSNDFINRFDTWFFDCDGVILDSNALKGEAFEECVKYFGKKNAEQLLLYHKENGGLSRFKKFEYFQTHILKSDFDPSLNAALCEKYANLIFQKLIDCPFTEGFLELISELSRRKRKIFVVSGGAQEELLEIFRLRKIDHFFEGIFGSPRTKFEILEEIFAKYGRGAEVFLGDSKIDWEVAKFFQLHFVFVEKYSEWKVSTDFFLNNRAVQLYSLVEMLGK